jgi:hypothetical protein
VAGVIVPHLRRRRSRRERRQDGGEIAERNSHVRLFHVLRCRRRSPSALASRAHAMHHGEILDEPTVAAKAAFVQALVGGSRGFPGRS